MRRVGRIVALVVLLGLASVAGASEHQGGNNDYPEGEVLVLLKAPVTAESVSAAAFRQALSVSAAGVAASAGAQAVSSTPTIAEVTGKDIVLLRSGEKTTAELLQALEGNPAVLAASPNYRVYATRTPNDPGFTNNSLWGLNAIRAPAAWDRSVGSRSVYVAVLDSGINYNHEDLTANMGRDLSGRYGWDFWNNDDNPMDDNGHGTHVAGTIGAVGNNDLGVTGVNWEVSLLAVKVLDSNGDGSFATVARGLDYITAQKRGGRNIRVANLSLAGWVSPYSDAVTTLRTACRAAADQGILLVFAAGNDGYNIDNPIDGERPYPASFDESNMITVTAINSSGYRAYNYGSRSGYLEHLPRRRIQGTERHLHGHAPCVRYGSPFGGQVSVGSGMEDQEQNPRERDEDFPSLRPGRHGRIPQSPGRHGKRLPDRGVGRRRMQCDGWSRSGPGTSPASSRPADEKEEVKSCHPKRSGLSS